MRDSSETILHRDATHQNNFGALRLILASLVIVSHVYPARTGSFHGEPLWIATRGQMELGAVAVNLFFVTSGFLITLSWLRSANFGAFMLKRVLRIYPGFIVASLISLLIIAPLSGAAMAESFTPLELVKHVLRVLVLSSPKAASAFADHPIPVLNLSLWTIRYEFICYLLVPLICALAMRIGRGGVLALFIATLVWHAQQGAYLVDTGRLEIPLLGSADIWPRFLCYFLCGAVVALYRDVIPYRGWIAAGCLVALVIAARWTGGFFIVFALCGSYLLFYIAYQRAIPAFGVGKKRDLSYGAYLYGWPIEMLFIHYLGHRLGPWMIVALSLPVVLTLAALSWRYVEEPFMRAKANVDAPPSPERRPKPARRPPATMNRFDELRALD